MRRPDTNNYRALFLNDTPMMDMRAPIEFSQGAFPAALSLPLMSDEERAQVGICYKEHGQSGAIELGHTLVAGAKRRERMARWSEFAQSHERGYLYCFRGGLRSQTVQRWLREAGVDYPLVEGGYKAMRRFLLDELQRSIAQGDFVLIAGKTGTGKTRVINQLTRSVDLEGLANHRGSSFGQLLEPQPQPIDFENSLSIAFMKLLDGDKKRIYLEDEGRLIGRLCLPEALLERMKHAPVAVVEHSMDERIDIVIEDYVVDLGRRFTAVHGDRGPQMHAEKLQQDLFRIRKRLGSERHSIVSNAMREAFELQWQGGDLNGHRLWTAALLDQYYDAMYDYQFSQRSGAELFRGTRDQVIAWARQSS